MELLIITVILALTFMILINKVVNKANEKISDKEQEIKDLKNKKREYNEEEKKEWVKKRNEAIEKGKKYEEQIAEHFRVQGYLVDERGKRKGLNDKGIDILIKKDDIYTLIQCKNYSKNTQLTQKQLRIFYGDCINFIENNNLNKETTKLKLIISNQESLTIQAKKYIKEYNNFECIVIEYN